MRMFEYLSNKQMWLDTVNVTIGNDPGSLHKTNQIDLTAKRYGPLNYLSNKQIWLDTVNVTIGNDPGSLHKTNQIDLTD